MAKLIAQIIILGSQLVGKAFVRALREEIEITQEAAKRRAAMKAKEQATVRKGISLKEAKDILDVDELNPEEINKRFTKLFENNEKAKGGSFYLQSKVFRAKERLDFELKQLNDKQKKTETGESTDTSPNQSAKQD